jgi:hypothetical protein
LSVTGTIPPEIRAALEEVLAYNYDEEKDFENREDEDRTGHIYYALRKIRRWLDDTPSQ